MIKQKLQFEVKINDRSYELYISPESPLGEIHDALMQMKGVVLERMIAAQKADEKKPEPEA